MLRFGVFVASLLVLNGCLGYTSALGFRARRAVLEDDAARFEELMEEAVDTTPAGPLDDPERTVLTHFLDLAHDPLFFPYIERWLANGWIDDAMTCAIHRARYRAMVDPADAQRSADVCIARARAAAEIPEREWEVERCLDEAPFLVETSTAALLPYLAMVGDPKEPLKFRYGLLDGMSRVDIATPSRLRTNDASLTREQASAIARTHVDKQSKRLDFVVDTVQPLVDSKLLAAATARGVLEVENVMVQLGRSYIGTYATSDDEYRRALAWGWVLSQKSRERVPDIAPLGLYEPKETKEDAYWYLCSREGAVEHSALGASSVVEAMSIRRDAPVDDTEALRAEHCHDDGGPYPTIRGPYPLEATARGSVAAELGARTSVRLRRRILE